MKPRPRRGDLALTVPAAGLAGARDVEAFLSEERDAWREHAVADCAALRRVWALTGPWAQMTGPSITASLHRDLAAEVRAAITGEEQPDGEQGSPD